MNDLVKYENSNPQANNLNHYMLAEIIRLDESAVTAAIMS